MSKLSWNVYIENFNSKCIEVIDIFAGGYWEQKARDIYAEHPVKEIWEEEFRRALMSRYWSRAEYEIILTSWPPYIPASAVFDLQKEIDEHKEKWGYVQNRVNINPTVCEKIDIYDQLQLNWDIFINYVWKEITQ